MSRILARLTWAILTLPCKWWDHTYTAFANTTGEDESEWLYDNRERAHVASGCWCGSPNEEKS